MGGKPLASSDRASTSPGPKLQTQPGAYPLVEWEQRVRRLGGGLTALALLGVLVGGAVYGYTALVADGALTDRATQLIVGSLITGILGSMLLLIAPDTLPPEERP